MINLKNNLDVIDRVILKYLIDVHSGYELFDEMNNVLDRYKIMNKIHYLFFINPMSQTMFKIIKSFYNEYKKMPNIKEIAEKADLDLYDIDSNLIADFFSVDVFEYTPSFIFKYLKAFVIRGNLNYKLISVTTKIKTDVINVDNIEQIFADIKDEFTSIDLEFTDTNSGLSVKDPKSHIQIDVSKKPTGIKFLDDVIGGWEEKTLTVFQGRPKVGKTLVLSNIAVYAAKMGLNVMVVSVELSDRKYVKRIGSNLFDIHSNVYNTLNTDEGIPLITKLINKKLEKMPTVGDVYIKEYPTDGVGVFDIENYIKSFEVRENMKFDLVVVDYINLLKSERNEENMYKRIKELAQNLRKIAQRNKWAVVTATQIKQSYFNSDDMEMDASAESSNLPATVDALFGLLSPLTSANTIPLEGTDMLLDYHFIKIKNLANRDGGNMGSWAWFHKDFNYYRIGAVEHPNAEFYTDRIQPIGGNENNTFTPPTNFNMPVIDNNAITEQLNTPISTQHAPDDNMPINDVRFGISPNYGKLDIIEDNLPSEKETNTHVEFENIFKIMDNDNG